MSDFRAIATVTATIAYMLGDVRKEVPAATVTTKPPDVVVGGAPYAGLNIFLYQVNMNTGYRNADQPARNSSDDIVKRPQLPLNLRYLLTATGDGDDDIQAHEILASAMRILYENPILTRDIINQAILAQAEIAGSDLANQVELVKITPLVLSLDEMTKLWGSFFQTKYRVSAPYEATLVLLDGKKLAKPALPVLTPQFGALPFSQPLITSLDQQVVEADPAATITINGLNLIGDQIKVTIAIDGVTVTPDPKTVTTTKISVPIPSNVMPGVKTVQVVQTIQLSSSQPSIPFLKSNTAAFVLAPKVTTGPPINATRGAPLPLSFIPSIGPEQVVEFLIGDFSIPIPQRDPSSGPVNTLTAQIPANLPTGTFLLRIRADGAESLLKVDNITGQFIAPTAIVS